MITLRKHRFVFIFMSLSTILVALAPLFLIASCRPLQQTPQELQARQTLRSMTRGGVLPAEDAVAKIEKDFPKTTAGSLAKIVHARIKLNAKDFAGAATLLDSSTIRDYTVIGDYALWLRAGALEQAIRRVEARAAYEQLARNYPASLRAREATLHDAQMFMEDGQATAVPVALKQLAAKDDAAPLLLTAKAYEQTGDSTRALSAYRRIYFFAPASAEAQEAATGLTRLNSALSPTTAEEAIARAEKLFATKRFSEAFDAYTDAFVRFPNSATPELQARRAIAAANARRYADATAALTATPAPIGEARAEAMFNLALAYGRAKQWAQARSMADELHRAFPSSTWSTRAFVQLGQRDEEAKEDVNASYFYSAAVNFYPGAVEVTPAQFYIAWQAHEAKNFAESSRLLTEHLAVYADRNTDFRGKAAYWAARDSERAGKLAEARAIYEGLQARYDANWYGYLAKQRLENMARNRDGPQKDFGADSMVGRALANLKTVTVAEETPWPSDEERRSEKDPRDGPGYAIARAEQLSTIATNDWALEELAAVASMAP